MAVSFFISYRLSARGKREAIKAGLDPNEVQSYHLSPGEPFYNGFADLIDLDKIQNDEEMGQWVSHLVGAPFGYKVKVWDFDSTDDETVIEEWENPSTQVFFDRPMDISDLLEFEQTHQAKKGSAREHAEKELEQQLEKERKAAQDMGAKIRAEALQWLEDNAHWGQLEAYKNLASALDSGADIGFKWSEGGLWRRAQDSVALAAEVKEAAPWIKNHGSKRLKQILKENLLVTSMTVYRDERLEAEHPGWEWVRKSLSRLEDPRNPTEALLDLLETARLDFPDCKLRWDREAKNGVILAAFLGKQVRMKDPVPAKQPVSSFPDDDIPF